MATETTEPKADTLPDGWATGQREARVRQLAELPRRVRVLLAAGWARSVLPLFEVRHPADGRPRRAIEAAERWAAEPSEDNRAAAAAASAASAAAAADASAAASAADAASAAASAAATHAASAADAAYAAAAAAASAASAAAAADASAAASAADAAARKKQWLWTYATFRHARGPKGAAFDPRWRTETAVALARGIVAERAFDRMPVLADAVEEAGCDLAGVLNHLRTPGDEFTAADWVLCQLLRYGGG